MRRLSRPGRLPSVIQRLLTYFVVLWLAVIYPAVCQYHGMMLFASPTLRHAQDATMAGAMPPAQTAPAPGHAVSALPAEAPPAGARGPRADPSQPGLWHRPVPLDAAPMSLLGLALPLAVACAMRPTHTRRVVAALAFAHQHAVEPPEQPPRPLPA
jgi:hypothetical protein